MCTLIMCAAALGLFLFCERSVAYYLLFSLTQIGGVELFDARKVKWLQECPKMESCIHRQGYEDANTMVCFNNIAITNALLVVSIEIGVFKKKTF